MAPSREIVHGVADGRWEIGFGPFLHQMPGYFTQVSCFEETRQLVIARRHPERARLAREALALLKTQPLITSYLEEPAPRGGAARLRDHFAVIWEISHLDLRLALVGEGRGVTYVSDLIIDDLPGLEPVPGLPFSSIARHVGLYYQRHQPLSQAGARFVAMCRQRWQPAPGAPGGAARPEAGTAPAADESTAC